MNDHVIRNSGQGLAELTKKSAITADNHILGGNLSGSLNSDRVAQAVNPVMINTVTQNTINTSDNGKIFSSSTEGVVPGIVFDRFSLESLRP